MANKTETIAFAIGDEIAEKLGVEVVDVNYKTEAGKRVLRIFIDKEGGTGIDDCETFSRAFEERFDEEDPIEDEYTLEVSSPGVDRKLVTEREFLHYLGREVDVKLYKAENGRKEFTGILSAYKDGKAEILTDGEIILVSGRDAAYIRLHFEI